jgi:hypothetical protein
MSGTDKKSNHEDNENNPDDESSNLDFLGNQPAREDLSKDSNNDTNKKKAREWAEKESAVKRIFINNRGKDKKMENDQAYEGIYLYKPGVELPSLYQYANQTVNRLSFRSKSSLLQST